VVHDVILLILAACWVALLAATVAVCGRWHTAKRNSRSDNHHNKPGGPRHD
jgi:hypothetical protein